ncbi:MAG TPA: aldo/keto reductase [Stellaceae bacterium]|nr:aldo/keto reductase [Stellaceae bacterium]
MRYLTLPDGERIPALGLGTWMMGEQGSRGPDIIAALCHGLGLGMSLIDTAEMYGNGGAEELVGKTIAGRRDQVFLVSKVLPQNATRKGAVLACEKSLKRLHTDRIDLYLLHWRGNVPLTETIEAFVTLRQAGKIRHWGVSNFDLADMEELWALPEGKECASNQVLYNPGRRGVEFDLLPALRKRGLPMMAYSPLEQGRLLGKKALKELAQQRGVTSAQIAIAWVLRQDGVMTIPKAARASHLDENLAALDLKLSSEELALLDAAFPPPRKKIALALL